jgi:hypothetical protein
LRAQVEAGKLRMPRIDHSFNLSQIEEALAQSSSKRTVGKAVRALLLSIRRVVTALSLAGVTLHDLT